MGRKRFRLAWISLLVLLILTACSGGANSESAVETEPKTQVEVDHPTEADEQQPVTTFSSEPVELLVATPWGEEYFNSRISDVMREKLPHIQVTHVDWNGTIEQMQEHNASQIVPDIVLAFTGQAPLEELEMVFPLDEKIKEYGVDLSTIDPAIIAQVRSRDKQGRLIGIPQEMGVIGHYWPSLQ